MCKNYGFFEGVVRFRIALQRLVEICQANQGTYFPGTVGHLSCKRQGLLVECERPLRLASIGIHSCHVVDGGSFPGAVADFTHQEQGLRVEFESLSWMAGLLIQNR